MTPEFKVEVGQFQQVMRQWLLHTSRELSVAVNTRMSFLLMRAFALMPPRAVDAKRQEIRNYMRTQIGDRRMDKKTGKKVGSARILRRVHLIAQARNAKIGKTGLYGADMKKAAAKISRAAVGSVGFLKSALIDPIRKFNGHFMQTGRNETRSRDGRVLKAAMNPNAAFLKMLDQYGVMSGRGNVSKMRGAKATIFVAKPGFGKSLDAKTILTLKVADGQEGNVQKIYADAFTIALRDERLGMEKIVNAALQEAAVKAGAKDG